MSIKGFPSSQKLPLGTGITNEFVTVAPSDQYRYSLDVNRPLFRVDSAVVPRTAAANTGNIDGMTWVYDTSTPAHKGDFVRFETGNAQYIEVPIVKVETNRFMLGALVNPAPAAGDTFYILRSVSPLLGEDGTASITASNPSVGLNGDPAPLSSTEMGFIDATGDLQGVSATNPLPVTVSSITGSQTVDIEYALGQYVASNSTTTPLGISGNFTGTWTETTNFATIQCGVYSDQSSSSLGFKIEFSVNGSTVAHTHYYTYEASSNGTGYTFQPEFKYFRINYTNDGVAQTTFTLYTAMKPVALFPSQYRVEQAVTGQSQALVTKGVIYGLTTGGGGGYVAAKVNPSGALVTATTIDAGTNIIGRVGIDQTTNGTTNAVYVNNFPATQPVSGTFWQATQPVSVVALPATTGRAKVGQLYNDYSSTNVTTSAYVQLIASTASTVNKIEIFDSSGEALILAVGAAGSEVDQLYIFPGGNGPVDIAIPASSRISVKAKTATASSGFLAINLYS